MSNLSVLFQVSVSVFCIIATVTSLVILICVILFYRELSRLASKTEGLIQSMQSTADEAKSLVISSIETLGQLKNGLFTLEVIKNIFSKIVDKFLNKEKGVKDEG